MSKQLRTAVDNKFVQQCVRKALDRCTLKDCELCEELRQSLARAKKPAPLHLD